jgi:hypothetical protein
VCNSASALSPVTTPHQTLKNPAALPQRGF